MDETTTTSSQVFTEAPAAATIRFALSDYECLLTLRDVTGAAVLTRLQGAITHLQKIGATARPPAPEPTPAPAATQPTNQGLTGQAGNGHADGDPPICPIHSKAMKKSNHGGWYCPVKILDDDGSGKAVYCKAKA